MKKQKVSLTLKVIILCIGLVLLTSLTMQYFAYKTSRSAIKVSMGHTALNITQSIINVIDVEKFNGLQSSEDMNSDYYQELRQELNKIRNSIGLKYLYTMRYNENGEYIYVVDGAAKDDQEASLLGDTEKEITDPLVKAFQGIEGFELSYSKNWGGNLISAYLPIKNTAGEIVGILAADFDADHVVKELKQANQKMVAFSIIIIIIGIMIGAGFSYLLIRSLKELQAKIQVAKQGDLTVKTQNSSKDEVGALAEAFEDMLGNMASMIHNIRSNTEEVIQKVIHLNNSINDTAQSTEEITMTINEIASGAADQVENVENVTDSIEKVFTEIESITNNIAIVNGDSNEAMKDTKEAAEILKSSVHQIALVNETVEVTANRMKQLETRFLEILSFSDTVNAIASQTNLLSLNASIEAASAGEHGKGFAVVAGEIKNLAKQSGDASKRIKEMIKIIQEEIGNSSLAIENGVNQARSGVEVITKVDTYLDKLFQSNQKVDKRIKEIIEAISNIGNDSKFVLENVVKLSDISRDFSAGAQQAAAATEEQTAVMEVIRNDLSTVRDRMEGLGVSVKIFKVD